MRFKESNHPSTTITREWSCCRQGIIDERNFHRVHSQHIL